MVTDLER